MAMPSTPERQVLDAVTAADQRRRSRDARAELSRLAPVAGGLALLTAGVGRLLGWSPWVALVVLAGLAGALALRVLLTARARPISDAIAARVDADAGLAGELRSAHWFAKRAERTDWADYHLTTAAKRAGDVNWAGLYPAAPAGRSWAGTAGLGALALVVALAGMGQGRVQQAEVSLADLEAARGSLPDELQLRLDQLLSALEAGEVPPEGALTLEELQALMAQFDPELQQKLAQLAEARNLDEARDEQAINPDDLNDMLEDTTAGLPEDVRWALEDMANRLANSEEERQTNAENPSASQETGEPGLGSEQAETQNADAGESAEAGMQMMRQSASDAGESQMMMAGAGAMGGDSAGGEGGNQGNGAGEGEFESIAQALRQELIEAAQDIRGDNVQPEQLEEEDIRRKTEQGTSSLGFTRVAPATFDRSRAVAPPTVPDARRPLLFRYFIRQQ